MNSAIEEFFRTGDWTAACEDLPHEAWGEALRQPWMALSLLWDPKRRNALKAEGWSPSEIVPHVEAARDAVASELAREGVASPFELAIWRLLVRSLLDSTGSSLFPVADEGRRREWLRSVRGSGQGDGAGLDFIGTIEHSTLLRLAVNRGSLATRDANDRRDLALVILHAAAAAAGERHASQNVRLLLAAARVWVLSHEGEDLDDRPELVFGAFGHSPDTVRQVVAAMSVGRAASAELLVEPGRTDPNGIEASPLSRDSASFYGAIVDPAAMAAIGNIEANLKSTSDPWTAAVLVGVLADFESGRSLVSTWPAIAEGGLARADAIEILLTRALVGIEVSELTSTLDGDPSLAGGSLYDRLFRRGIEHSLGVGIGATRDAFAEFGLSDWFDIRVMAFKSGSSEGVGIAPGGHIRSRLAGAGPRLAASPVFAPLAEELLKDGSQAGIGEERHRAEKSGRGWLHTLVVSVARTEGRLLESTSLTNEDRGVLQRLVEACRERQGQWWGIELDLPTELRMIEVAVTRCNVDSHLLEDVAGRVAARIATVAPAADRIRFQEELDRCRESLVSGTVTVRPKLLDAFRRGDEVAFLEIFETPAVDIAQPGTRVRVLDVRAWILIALILLPVGWAGARWILAGPAERGDVPELIESQGGSSEPPRLLARSAGWNRLPGTRERWFLVLDRDQCREFLGERLTPTEGGGRSVQLPRDLSGELFRRFRIAMQARFVGGVETGDDAFLRWDDLQIRLPRKLDESELRQSRAGVPGTFWLEDGSMAAPAVVSDSDVASTVVIIDERI